MEEKDERWWQHIVRTDVVVVVVVVHLRRSVGKWSNHRGMLDVVPLCMCLLYTVYEHGLRKEGKGRRRRRTRRKAMEEEKTRIKNREPMKEGKETKKRVRK